MKHVLLIALTICLCSNECERPSGATIKCFRTGNECFSFSVSGSITIHATDATVGWVKNKLHIGVYYTAKNRGELSRAILNVDSFSIISSSGIRMLPEHLTFPPNKKPTIVCSIPPGGSIDSLFIFDSKNNFNRVDARNIFQKDTFYFVVECNSADTIFKIIPSDVRLKSH